MRQLVTDKNAARYGEFVARGRESSRLEQLSDCIFALAITMLLVSTSAPQTYSQLVSFVSDMLAFAICIVLVMWIWHGHYQFFLRFGLRNMRIIVLNTLLMIVVLFYVYPLKFLSSFLIKYSAILLKGYLISDSFFNELRDIRGIISWHQMPALLLIYNVGFISIFSIYIFMHREVLKNKLILGLDRTEEILTRSIVAHYTGIATIGIVSTGIAVAGLLIGWSFAGMVGGIIYFLIGPVSYIIGKRYEKQLAEPAGEKVTPAI